MTVEELRNEVEALESKINSELKEFTEKTGVNIKYATQSPVLSNRGKNFDISIDLEL